jgi:hypothetical protein
VNRTDLRPQPMTRYVGLMLTAGGVLAAIANLLHPRYSGEDVDVYHQIAGSTTYLVATLALTGALLVVTIGLVGLADHIGPGHPVAHAGRITAMLGGTIAVIQSGVDLGAVRQQAITFADAGTGDQVGAFWSTNSLDRLSSGLFALWTVILLGLTPLLLSTAVRLAGRPLRWHRSLTWLGALGGLACLAVGVADLFAPDQGTTTIAFTTGSVLVTLWILGTGAALLTQQSAAVAATPESVPTV